MTKKAKDSKDPSAAGKKTPRDPFSWTKPLPADDPLFSRGWIVGERRSKPLSKRTQAKKSPSDSGKSKPTTKQH